MQFNKFILSLALCTTVLSADAWNMDTFAEIKYDMLNGKAHSVADTANSTTSFASLSGGVMLNNYNIRVYLSYDPIRWEDAQTEVVTINADYLQPILTENLKAYMGAGIGTMKYKGDPITDEATKEILNIRAGVNYDINSWSYVTVGVRYIFTNSIEIKDNASMHSKIDNLVGGEVGLGIKF